MPSYLRVGTMIDADELVEFADRSEVGRRLARRLERFRGSDAILLGLPRGGVAVAAEIAGALELPLDVLVVRKIGDPAEPEYGLGAVSETGEVFLDEARALAAGYRRIDLESTIEAETREAGRRARKYRGGRPGPELHGRAVILVDDGIATGGTVEAAVHVIRGQHPRRLVLAVGVCPEDTYVRLGRKVDEIECLLVPKQLLSVGQHFRRFDQLTDADVLRQLNVGLVARPTPAPAATA
jgi:putative phosphoribosyl transferase